MAYRYSDQYRYSDRIREQRRYRFQSRNRNEVGGLLMHAAAFDADPPRTPLSPPLALPFSLLLLPLPLPLAGERCERVPNGAAAW